MGKAVQEPDPSAGESRFLVGRDTQGYWVVRDRRSLVGGLFTNRASAIDFAEFESDHVPGAVACAPEDAIVTLAGLRRAGRQSSGTGRRR